MSESGLQKAVVKNYITKAPANITGSNLKPLDWRTTYKDPERFTNISDLRRLFAEIGTQDSVSDVIIMAGEPIALKTKHLGLRAITHRIMDLAETTEILKLITDTDTAMVSIQEGKTLSGQAKLLEQDIDLSITENALNTTVQIKNRYRYEVTGCSTSKTERGFSIIMRPLPPEPVPYQNLGLTEDFVKNCIVKDGIVIVAGATGEGKSTTLSSIVRYILENDTLIKGIILTHEDPIEVSYERIKSEHSIVIQSSIGQGQNVLTFSQANRSAMRRSPNLVLVGELRDEETIQNADELSITGHPVFATTHANNIATIFPRLISRFPSAVQEKKTFDLINSCRMLVSQKLIIDVNGKSFAVREILKFTPSLRKYLLKFANEPSRVIQKLEAIMENSLFGAESYETQGKRLLLEGKIDKRSYDRLVENTDSDDDNQIELLNNY